MASALMAARGYEGTTLRAIAAEAGVSVGALYKHFPNKQAVVLALYDQASADFVATCTLPEGPWRARFLAALDHSLATLAPHRPLLAELVPVLVGDRQQGLFAADTAFSRARVEGVFLQAAAGAPAAEDLGRSLYLLHLAVVLFWLLDESPEQQATAAVRRLLAQGLTPLSVALRLPGAAAVLRRLAGALTAGLFGGQGPA
ncbi:MAG: helix-turn-helix transcriptional regulator [Myxococcales bacterium]|nr:helix-turn-helix transcriptional regulator [Myxococcales bacterium]MCB9525267.1 helix-turn-helix transcriptional regulator [Myxococcales bacterium]